MQTKFFNVYEKSVSHCIQIVVYLFYLLRLNWFSCNLGKSLPGKSKTNILDDKYIPMCYKCYLVSHIANDKSSTW